MASEGDLSQNSSAAADSEAVVNMDERLATLLHLQQMQQKKEVTQLMESHPVTNADAEFRRGLEELVRDHLNTCMAIASCSSAHDASGSGSLSRTPSLSSVQEESASSHSHHHHVLMSEAGDSHASGPSQSQSATSNDHHQDNEFGLSVHVDGQHMVEVENEAERLGPPLQPREIVSEHSPSRPQSRILNRWDDRQTQEMITTMERQARESELLALASLHTVTMLDASFLQESASPRSESAFERPQRRASSLLQMWRELEGDDHDADRSHTLERAENSTSPVLPGSVEPVQDHQSQEFLEVGDSHPDFVALQVQEVPDYREEPVGHHGQWGSADPDSTSSEHHGHNGSAAVGNAEREGVRQIMQRWMMQAGVEATTASSSSQSNVDAIIGQGERERIRQLAREWVRASSQHAAGTSQGRANSQQSRTNSPHSEGPNAGSVEGVDRIGQESLDLGARRQRDIQMGLDLLMRSDMERQRELQGLSQHRAVSHFAHRSRLQSFLRGRFLRNGANLEEERPPSLAAGEIGQLRQRRAVSGLREGFRFRLENILASQVNHRSAQVEESVQDATRRRYRMQQTAQQVPRSVEGENGRLGVGRDWHGIAASRRISELQDAAVYNMELRELLSRRSVTTILASEFRDRLDLLIESFIERSGRSARPWNFTRPGQTVLSQRQQAQQLRRPTQRQDVEGDTGSDGVPPPPPPPPPAPLHWPQGPQWTPRPQHHEMDLQSTSDLRADLVKLQRGLADLQRMMEASMEMQLELQRSIRQEVAGALHQAYGVKGVPEDEVDGSKWLAVKNGTCCICCDKHIDSLLYRCGHMCTCLKCASELFGNNGKCPMCRAPIVEVVRAYTVA